MRELRPAFVQAGITVRFIVIGSVDKARRFCAEHDCADLCVGDIDKRSYRAMRLGDFNVLKLFTDPDLRARRAENSAAGFRQNWKATRIQDGAQLPGAAFVDATGTVRWLHRGAHPGDLPAISAMLASALAANAEAPAGA